MDRILGPTDRRWRAGAAPARVPVPWRPDEDAIEKVKRLCPVVRCACLRSGLGLLRHGTGRQRIHWAKLGWSDVVRAASTSTPFITGEAHVKKFDGMAGAAGKGDALPPCLRFNPSHSAPNQEKLLDENHVDCVVFDVEHALWDRVIATTLAVRQLPSVRRPRRHCCRPAYGAPPALGFQFPGRW